jgi:streptomycin 6-kinase
VSVEVPPALAARVTTTWGAAGTAWLDPDPWVRDGALVGLVRPRLEQLADGLGQPLERVTAWGFVQAVLSTVWSAESGEAPDDRCLDVAALLLPRLS